STSSSPLAVSFSFVLFPTVLQRAHYHIYTGLNQTFANHISPKQTIPKQTIPNRHNAAKVHHHPPRPRRLRLRRPHRSPPDPHAHTRRRAHRRRPRRGRGRRGGFRQRAP